MSICFLHCNCIHIIELFNNIIANLDFRIISLALNFEINLLRRIKRFYAVILLTSYQNILHILNILYTKQYNEECIH